MIEKIKKYWRKFIRLLTQNRLLLLTVGGVYIFQAKIADWIIALICPITAKVDKNNIWVLVIIAAAILLVYLINGKRQWRERTIFVSRLWTLGLLYLGYWIIVQTGEFEFYQIKGWPYNYVDCAWLLIAGIETLWLLKRFVVWCIPNGESKSKPFLTDAPATIDEMGREKYARQLVQKIKGDKKDNDPKYADGALTILLNEHYGVGKTSFMYQLQQIAEKERVDVCWFKPWLYEDSKSMVLNFIRVIQEQLGEDDKSLQRMLSKYAQILASIKGYEIFSFFQYDGMSVETQFEEIKIKLRDKKRPVIVLIDDVDRLLGNELLRMLQMIRNMGDFPYIYYIIAGDKVAIEEALAAEGIVDPDEYLKKFFNLEICFPADDGNLTKFLQTGIESILGRYGKSSIEVWNFIQNLRYGQAVFDNIRDIKRYLNVLDYALSNCQAEQMTEKTTMLDEVSLRDLAGLCMIQCVDSEFYRMLRDHNERILEYKDWHYKVKSDYSDVFTDRYTKEMIEKVAEQTTGSDDNSSEIKKELAEKVQSLSDFVRWSIPKKKEVISELMEILFPRGMTEGSKIGVCHPTEYYKYFSAAYRKTDVSNAEVIGIMQMDKADYAKAIEGILSGGKKVAFKHKLKWYMQTGMYDRLSALKKVMTAYEMEMKEEKGWDSFKEVIFMQNYGASMMAAFRIREEETDEQTKKAWEELREWLITTETVEQRIYVLSMFAGHVDNHSAYVFGSRKEVLECLKASEKEFVENIWATDRYNPDVYQYIRWYKELDADITEYVIKEIKRRKCNVGFLYHLLEYKKGVLQWNYNFVDTILGTKAIFKVEDVSWFSIVPIYWREEFRNFYMQNPLQKEEISASEFLSSALSYWKGELELTEDEAERLMYIHERGTITAKQMMERYNLSEGAARKILEKYVRLGYLIKEKRGTRVKYVKPVEIRN